MTLVRFPVEMLSSYSPFSSFLVSVFFLRSTAYDLAKLVMRSEVERAEESKPETAPESDW